MSNFGRPFFDVFVNVDYAYCQVMENLFLGTFVAANSKLIFEKHKIQRVLTVGSCMEPAFPMSCDYMIIKIQDSRNEDIYQFFDTTYEYIEKSLISKAPIFVHCQEGISRSASIVLSYFIKKFKWTYIDALNFVSKQRDFINPNKSFEKQLIEYHLRHNTNVLTDERLINPSKRHARNTMLMIKQKKKNVRISKKGMLKYSIIKVRRKKLTLKESTKVNYLVKFTRILGEKLMEWHGIGIDEQKMKLEKFAKDTKNYLEEVADINEKIGKKEAKIKRDNIRRLLKHKKSRIIDSFFSSTFIEDNEKLLNKKNP